MWIWGAFSIAKVFYLPCLSSCSRCKQERWWCSCLLGTAREVALPGPLWKTRCTWGQGGCIWGGRTTSPVGSPSVTVPEDPSLVIFSSCVRACVCVGGRALIIGCWQLPFVLLKTLLIHQISKGNWSQNSSLIGWRSISWTPPSR